MAEKFEGFCMRCRTKREFVGEISTSKTGSRMAKGPCPECGSTVCRTLGRV